ncbi:hypothetical protein [Microbaculum marinum]|uniref:DUF4105 domain-containing protein n=1 Tax=Microbaculum marinum TaxID=1764581 RepID=A0AAW9RLS0_9HYPH
MSVWRVLAPAALVAAGTVAGCVGTDRPVLPTAYSFTDPAALSAAALLPARPKAERGDAVTGSYAVEFRARTGPDIIGHSYLVFGRLGAAGDIVDPVHTGLYPDDVTGFAFAVGGARATTESVPLDAEIAPTVVYRRALTARQYERLAAAVERARGEPPAWSWANYNCNTYLADLAREIGLETPAGSTWTAPTLFVAQLKALNG